LKDVHGRAAFFAILIASPIVCLALQTNPAEGFATFATKRLRLGVVGVATGANVPGQQKLAATSVTGDVLLVLANVYGIQAIGTGDFGEHFW
jgi:hypothetical protein